LKPPEAVLRLLTAKSSKIFTLPRRDKYWQSPRQSQTSDKELPP